jgi:ankyrin repeat protein
MFRTSRIALATLCLFAAAPEARSAPAAPKPAPELFLAIGRNDAAAVKDLLTRGASPNARNSLDMSALTWAAATGNVEIVKTLLAAGAEVNAPSALGGPLTLAAATGGPAVTRLLIQHKADISALKPDRTSVLMLAARNGDPETIRLLLARKADVAAADNHGTTALSYAAREGNVEAARLLLDAGAKVDAADADGWTPLMHAAVNGRADTVTLLLKRGAGLKAKERGGRTALLLATSYGDHPEVVRRLLSDGADVQAKDARGRSALALAETRGYHAAAKALRAGKARVAPAAAAARTPRQAVETSLPRLEQTMQVFLKRTGCLSCHHEGIGRIATGFARAHGYRISESLAREQEKRVANGFQGLLPLHKKAVQDPAELKNIPIADIGDVPPTYGALLLGLEEHGVAPSEALGEAAMALARLQSSAGDWGFVLQRVPVQSSHFTMTAMAMRALRAYAPKQYSAEVEERIGRAKQWLATTTAPDTEDRAFRLLGLKWAGATPEERKKAVEELRATQRPDGGWAQVASTASDAYATGSALFALSQGGDVPVSDPAYQRGVRFLLRTQEDDGTWYVYKRAFPANNYFDAGFPYGQSQYASFAGTSWATMALILAADKPQPVTTRR